MSKDTKVKCDVDSCRHNACHLCDLKELKISSSCDGCDCCSKKETICSSFSKREAE